MANPRQRRKARSGLKPLSQSRKSQKNQNKITFRGPPVLANAWDSRKTVRQNYDAMGLMSTANPRMAGGLAPLPVAPFVERQRAEAEAIGAPQAQEALSAAESSGAAQSSSAKVPKGYARLIRDEQGNVVDVEFADEDEQEEEQAEADPDAATPWGTPLDVADRDSKPVNLPADQGIHRSQGIPMPDSVTGDGIHVPHKPRPAPTRVVQELERMASQQRAPEKRFVSDREQSWLVDLIRKHGDDVQAMSRDIKGNPWQKTPAQIRKSIKVAGGMEALKSAAAA